MKDKRGASLILEIDEINRLKRKHPEVVEFSTKFISKLKSEAEGRGVIPEEELNRLRKVFRAMTTALEVEE